MVLSSSDLINEAAGYAKYPAACYMYAPPKAAVLASVVLSFVPVAGGTLRRLFCLILYPVKLFQYAFALRRLLFFGRFSFDLLLPFCKLPLITLYYALSLIVGGHECLPVGIAMLLYHTGNSVFEIADFLFGGLYFCFNCFSLLAFENACDFCKLLSQLRQLGVLYLFDLRCTLSEPVQELFHLFEYFHVDTGLRFRRQLRLTDQKLQNRLCFLYDGAE